MPRVLAPPAIEPYVLQADLGALMRVSLVYLYIAAARAADQRGDAMIKTTTVLAGAVTLALAAISSPSKVEAQTTGQIITGVVGGTCRRRDHQRRDWPRHTARRLHMVRATGRAGGRRLLRSAAGLVEPIPNICRSQRASALSLSRLAAARGRRTH